MQETELQNLFKNLSKKVAILCLERQQQAQQEDSDGIIHETTADDLYIKTKMLMTELEMAEDRKNIIYVFLLVTLFN
ncbi:hypothetical protein AYI69_g5349 [Smittium culicis]|uniref:Uncharacterized protein n=1 Tax=Smittium culicis TaxID=133412 RepID=A0A1R1Y6M0_9FUNG|nr:hypothetical protein AYI69_g5349 [Smittium culicis]